MRTTIILFKTLLALLLLTVALPGLSQSFRISGTVLDAQSEEPIPFASVRFRNTGFGGLTDSAGHFAFTLTERPSDTLEISCVGYQPFYLTIGSVKDLQKVSILMERGKFNESASVRVKVNKGLLVWRKIVQHKAANDRYRFDNFSYELYNKLELDLKNINFEKLGKFKPLKSISDLINDNIDTAEGLRYLPSYLTEALSDYYYQKKPLKRREIIKAANTNGAKNESVIKLLGGMDQVINVYNNFIPVFDKEFVSPASDNGDYYYNYQVADTQIVGKNRYYHLIFTPRRSGSNTFEGDCWVQAGSFAIRKMNLRLGKDANINFLNNLSLIQEYSLLDDSTWFLSKDKFVADISPFGKEKPGFIGRKTTTYRNVVVNDTSVTNELSKNKLLEEIITLPGADEKGKQYWAESRHEELSKTESGIIKMIDTLTNAPVFQKFTRTMAFLGTGYKDIGNFQIGPWFNWISTNGWEGLRLRFDLGTNKKFDKKWWWHIYLAYGFGDKKLKGKAELFYLPKKHPRFYLYGSYTNDLDHGQNYYGEVSSDNFFALAVRKPNLPSKFMKVVENRFEFFQETRNGFSTLLATTHKTYNPLRGLLPADSFPVNNGGTKLANFEVSLRLRFAYLEKFLENNFFRTSLGSPYPIGELYISHGFAGIFNSSYKYTKLTASVSDYIKIPPYGSISYYIYGGKTFGTLPYMLLDIAPGNRLYYYNKYAFNLMNRWEYVHDRYAGVNIEHIIGNGIFRLFPKLRWRQFWTAKSLWGSLSPSNQSLNLKTNSGFQTLNGHTYLELGTGVDNIFKVFRLDFVWRVLPDDVPKSADKNFGVFGSFRLNF